MTRLDRHQRLAGAGAVSIVVSLFLPWYGIAILERVKTGWGAFSLVEVALLLVCGAALFLLFARMQTRPLKLPLRDGTLLLAAGGWSAVLVFIRFFDRPADFRGFGYGLRFGVYVAFAGALAIAIAGVRERRSEKSTTAVSDEPGAVESRGTTAAGSGETPAAR